MLERTFEERYVTWLPFTSVDECIGGVLADEIRVSACGHGLEKCRS